MQNKNPALEDRLLSYSFSYKEGPYSSIRPSFIGHSICKKGHIYGPFRRKCYVFQYVLKGEGDFESPYGTYHPKAGDLIIMHRGDLVDYGCYNDATWECIWIDFECNEKLPKAFETGVIHSEEIKDCFWEFLKIPDMKFGQSAYAVSLIWKIISLLDTDLPIYKHYSYYVREAITLIRRHYIQKISVNDVAKALNLNRSYFCSLFKKEVGISPKEYIDDYKISAVCEILKQSPLRINEIAENAGYSDLSAFSKAFKQKTGYSPKEYREIHKK